MKTKIGTVGLVLCAMLKECYHENIAIEVLLEMVRFRQVSDELIH